MENPLEQLISTIERNAENDKVEVTNVKVFAERWRVEFRGTIEHLIAWIYSSDGACTKPFVSFCFFLCCGAFFEFYKL